ncbi:MAG: hypothetical protein CVV11_16820 [Gammaproteobacteria bacterium HGW-Gammaproteobacteria-15]|nr:MAG: hypothetical protein CVV11_16820 [Gammaproteobacteria bacterium HGW-Gammaproteobacteria-15]
MRSIAFLITLLLIGCSGEGNDTAEVGDKEPLFSLATPTLNISADMLENLSLQRQIGVLKNLAANQPIFFHFDIQHSALNGAVVVQEGNNVSAHFFTKSGFSFVALDQETLFGLTGKIIACYDALCTRQIQGSPVNVNVNIQYKPADATAIPSNLHFTSAEAGEASNLKTSRFVTIENHSRLPLVARVSSRSEQLLYQVSLVQQEGSRSEYKMNFNFVSQQSLANSIHQGAIDVQVCYDNSCQYPVKNGMRQISVSYDQLGEPYKEYASLIVSANVFPSGMQMAKENHLLRHKDVLVGYFYRDSTSFLSAFDLTTSTVNELPVTADLYNASSGGQHILVYEAQHTNAGVSYINQVYDWIGQELTVVGEFTSGQPLFNALIYKDSVYTYSADTSTPYRYRFGENSGTDYGYFDVGQTRFVTKDEQLYNISAGEHGHIQRWDLSLDEPHQLIVSQTLSSLNHCWQRYEVTKDGKVINNCAAVYELTTDTNTDFSKIAKLVVPGSHSIFGIATHPQKDEFVIVLHPELGDSCNPIKVFCGLILQRYSSSDLSLIDEYGWEQWNSDSRSDYEGANEYIFYDSSGDNLYMFSSDLNRNAQLRKISLP